MKLLPPVTFKVTPVWMVTVTSFLRLSFPRSRFPIVTVPGNMLLLLMMWRFDFGVMMRPNRLVKLFTVFPCVQSELRLKWSRIVQSGSVRRTRRFQMKFQSKRRSHVWFSRRCRTRSQTFPCWWPFMIHKCFRVIPLVPQSGRGRGRWSVLRTIVVSVTLVPPNRLLSRFIRRPLIRQSPSVRVLLFRVVFRHCRCSLRSRRDCSLNSKLLDVTPNGRLSYRWWRRVTVTRRGRRRKIRRLMLPSIVETVF